MAKLWLPGGPLYPRRKLLLPAGSRLRSQQLFTTYLSPCDCCCPAMGGHRNADGTITVPNYLPTLTAVWSLPSFLDDPTVYTTVLRNAIGRWPDGTYQCCPGVGLDGRCTCLFDYELQFQAVCNLDLTIQGPAIDNPSDPVQADPDGCIPVNLGPALSGQPTYPVSAVSEITVSCLTGGAPSPACPHAPQAGCVWGASITIGNLVCPNCPGYGSSVGTINLGIDCTNPDALQGCNPDSLTDPEGLNLFMSFTNAAYPGDYLHVTL